MAKPTEADFYLMITATNRVNNATEAQCKSLINIARSIEEQSKLAITAAQERLKDIVLHHG